MEWIIAIILLAYFSSPVLALPVASSDPSPVVDGRATSPTVVISPSNTVIGSLSGTVESYNGIYYADNPTGSLRLSPPQKLSTNLGDAFDASGSAAACPQMLISTESEESLFLEVAGFLLDSAPFQQATDQTEDCLTVSVTRPAGTTAGAGLPVLFWIFGGAFEASSNGLTVLLVMLLRLRSSGGLPCMIHPALCRKPSTKTSLSYLLPSTIGLPDSGLCLGKKFWSMDLPILVFSTRD